MNHNVSEKRTVYVISHKPGDSGIEALKNIINLKVGTQGTVSDRAVFDSPMDIHILLSRLSFEASKEHKARFRRFMWEQARSSLLPLECFLLNRERL